MNLKAMQEIMKKQNIDIIFLANIRHKDPHLYYFTHMESEYLFLIIEKNKSPIVYASSLEFEKTKQDSLIKNVKLLDKNPFELLNNIIKKSKAKTKARSKK